MKAIKGAHHWSAASQNYRRYFAIKILNREVHHGIYPGELKGCKHNHYRPAYHNEGDNLFDLPLLSQN